MRNFIRGILVTITILTVSPGLGLGWTLLASISLLLAMDLTEPGAFK